jgi:predicted TPR repeat methyltransferase
MVDNNKDLNVGSGWANAPSLDSDHNRQEYDEMAERYEDVVAGWQYGAPLSAASMMVNHLGSTAGRVLDCACGTGLTGAALYETGFRDIVGADISTLSLVAARAKDVYVELHEADLQKSPIAQFSESSFDAVQCIAAMAFIDAEPMFREMCRLSRPGGVVVYSQRVDLYEERGYERIEQQLADEGLWSPLETSTPQPYLPGHPDYQMDILVRFHAFRVALVD